MKKEFTGWTSQEFKQWMAEMKTAKLATSKKKCAALIGVSDRSIYVFAENGCDRRTMLACRAISHRLDKI